MARIEVDVTTRVTAQVEVMLGALDIPHEADMVEVILHFPNARPRTVKVPAYAFDPEGRDYLVKDSPMEARR